MIATALVIFAASRTSLAAPPEIVAVAEGRVQRELLGPLAAKERNQSQFSRARLPAQERRVRILDEEPRHDARGAAFLTFAVDARHGKRGLADDAGWRSAAITGCIYVDGGLFVQSGERHRPADFLLGKKVPQGEEHLCKEQTPDT